MSSCRVGLELVAFRPSASVSHGPTDSLDLHMVGCGYQANVNQVIQVSLAVPMLVRSGFMHLAPAAVLQAGLVRLTQFDSERNLAAGQARVSAFTTTACSLKLCQRFPFPVLTGYEHDPTVTLFPELLIAPTSGCVVPESILFTFCTSSGAADQQNAGTVLPVTGTGPPGSQQRPEQAACGSCSGKEDGRWPFHRYCGRHWCRRTGVPAGQLADCAGSSSSSSTTDWHQVLGSSKVTVQEH